MPYLPLAVLGLLLAINLFVGAFLLWLSCKICRVRRSAPDSASAPIGITFKRAVIVVLIFALCVNVPTIALWFTLSQSNDSWPLALLELAINVFLLIVFMRVLVSPTLGRAVLVGLLWQVFAGIYTAAFVLVVSFFLANGYILPTGAMAETARGYHKDVHCPACGFEFAINCSQEAEPSPGGEPVKIFACICPNCRQHIHFREAINSSYEAQNPDSMPIAEPALSGGDRFLVGRGLLGAGFIAPQRFDVVAHRYPPKPSMIYLKRIIGMPGETIAIQSGNLYALSDGPQYNDADTDQDSRDPHKGEELLHVNDPEAVRLFEQGKFAILRKNPDQILMMRHIVYDNDHPAKDQPARWQIADAWKVGEHGAFAAAGDSAERTSWLRYRHLLRGDDGKPSLIMDFTGYNTYQTQYHQPLLGANWVSDLLLECKAVIDNPQGELTLELSKGVDRFRARWDLSSGACKLLRVQNGSETQLDSKPTALHQKGSYRLRFADFDERLTVWVNDELPFGDGIAYEPPERAGPDAKNDLQPAGIGVRGAGVTIQELKLFRDTYYTTGGPDHGDPREADVAGGIEPTVPASWHKLEKPPVLTLYVQPGQYLVFGDNSAESSDSRTWGCVPERLLLGKAFFVYYPLQRVGPLR